LKHLRKKFLTPFKRIEFAHLFVSFVLFGSAIFFTNETLPMVIQLFIAVLVLLHHFDDKKLQKAIESYFDEINTNKNFQETLTESNNNAIIVIDQTRKILTFNKKAEEIFGYTKTEMLHKDNLHLIMPEGFFKKHDKASANFFKTKKSIGILNNTHELFGKRKDGEVFPILISFGVNKDANIVVANISDITHEQEAKNEQLRLINEIENTQIELISTLGSVIEGRDKSTKKHVDRVAHYSKELALLAGLSTDEAEKIRLASPLHDVGKIIIPDNILNKPAKLTKEEFDIIKEHPLAGYNLLKNSQRELFKTAAIIAYQHHEKYNGKGYPQGLKGEEIHIYGRITAIADVFDALSTPRVYKEAWDDKKVRDILANGSGEDFDPTLMKLFLENYDKFVSIRNSFI